MNGETFAVDPDFTVVFGVRSSLAMIGLATGVLGYWLVERQWDNYGTNSLKAPDDGGESGASSSYVTMNDPDRVVGQAFHYSGARDLVRVRTDESDDERYHPGQAAAKHTDAAQSIVAAQYYGTPEAIRSQLVLSYPLPKMMLIGLCIWNLSFLFDPAIGGARVYANFWNISCIVLSGLIGPLIAFPMRAATLERDAERMKTVRIAIVACSVLLCIAATVDPEVDGPWYFNVFGTLFVLFSYAAFMASRKMGHTWFLEGKPKADSDLLVHNMGPILLIFGVFLFWAGTNAVAMADLNQSYIPFWSTNPRGWCVFIAGMVFIVPGQLAMDLAFDQGSLPVTPGFRDMYVYKLDGNTFVALVREYFTRFDLVWMARLLETPLLGTIGWFLMGLSNFMPFGVRDPTLQKFLSMNLCFAIPVVQFFLVNPALWRSDGKDYEKWQKVSYGLFLALFIAIALSGAMALAMALLGIGLIVSGQRKNMHDERRRGISWLKESPTVNPKPQVFGLGQPLYILGWIMLCIAMSVPM